MLEKNINTEEFLKCLFKNVQMELLEIKNILDKVNSLKIKKVFQKDYQEYQNIKKEILYLGKIYKYDLENVGTVLKLGNSFITSIIFLNNCNDEKIVKIMLEKMNKKIIEIVIKMKAYNGKDVKVIVLAKRFKSILENNVSKLTKYL